MFFFWKNVFLQMENMFLKNTYKLFFQETCIFFQNTCFFLMLSYAQNVWKPKSGAEPSQSPDPELELEPHSV